MTHKTSHKTSRPTLDAYFMNIAEVIGTRATCDRAHVGAVLVRDNYILTTGYNGAPHGLPHCDEAGHEMENGHCVRTTHAEQNAIVQAALHGVSTEGATLYSTFSPCKICAKMIINAHIERVVSREMYRDASVATLFRQAGVDFRALKQKKKH